MAAFADFDADDFLRFSSIFRHAAAPLSVVYDDTAYQSVADARFAFFSLRICFSSLFAFAASLALITIFRRFAFTMPIAAADVMPAAAAALLFATAADASAIAAMLFRVFRCCHASCRHAATRHIAPWLR